MSGPARALGCATTIAGLWLAGCAQPLPPEVPPGAEASLPAPRVGPRKGASAAVAAATPAASAAPAASSATEGGCTAPTGPVPEGMVLVPEGAFTMGHGDKAKAESGAADADAAPAHEVTLCGFYLDKTEVTVAQYRACVTSGKCSLPATRGRCSYEAPGKDEHPVDCVSWEQASAYCGALGKRLPTEAEWEKAARGSDGRRYPWGDAAPSCELAVLDGCGGSAQVGSKPRGASPYGALDLVGNVWEWVGDWYDPKYFAESPPDNPSGPDEGEARVRRGGGHYYNDAGASSVARFRSRPSYHLDNLGFRCAIPLMSVPLGGDDDEDSDDDAKKDEKGGGDGAKKDEKDSDDGAKKSDDEETKSDAKKSAGKKPPKDDDDADDDE